MNSGQTTISMLEFVPETPARATGGLPNGGTKPGGPKQNRCARHWHRLNLDLYIIYIYIYQPTHANTICWTDVGVRVCIEMGRPPKDPLEEWK